MLVKTQAIVLHCMPYTDSTYIVHVYTREMGRASYLVRLAVGKQAGLRKALFQPLTLLEIQADHKGSRQLQRIKEAHCVYPFGQLPFDVSKSVIALFLAEVLIRALRDSENNPALFEFLTHSIQLLDLCEKGLANFHLVFLIKLTRYLGFYPNLESQQKGWYFDLYGGDFVPIRPLHNAWLDPTDAMLFARLMQITYENMGAFSFNHAERVGILHQTLNYYRMHLTDFPVIKSLEVLETVFASH